MQLNEYQKKALQTARSRDEPNELFHLVLGLVGEAGEIAEKFKKLVRDKNSNIAELDTEDMKKEFGDVLWYIAVLADYFDMTLDEIAALNIKKLTDRQSRGTLQGSGDNR